VNELWKLRFCEGQFRRATLARCDDRRNLRVGTSQNSSLDERNEPAPAHAAMSEERRAFISI
jgi:hypothetical protein